MVTTAVYTSVWLLAATVAQVAAIGPCDNALITDLMAANANDCPTDLLKTTFEKGPEVRFRVVSKTLADEFSCATGVLEKPENNVAVLHNKFSFINTSLGHEYVNYTILEGQCGFWYKYIKEESYVGFKIVVAYYDDGLSYGYYGCTNENTPFSNDNETYILCYTFAKDSPEVEASVLKCKAHMELVTGAKNLVVTPACDNDNEYLDIVLAKKKLDTP